MQFSPYSSCSETTLPESASLAKMSFFTASYMSSKHCVRPEGAQNLLHFENPPNTSLQTRWKIHVCRSHLWEKSCALVTMGGSGFLNFKFLLMFIFTPWHFLIARKTAGVLLITASITPPHLWSTTGKMSHDAKTRAPSTSFWKSYFPRRPHPFQAQQPATVSSRSNAFLVARFTHARAPRGICLTASPKQPQLTCPLCLNKGVCVQH